MLSTGLGLESALFKDSDANKIEFVPPNVRSGLNVSLCFVLALVLIFTFRLLQKLLSLN